MLTDLARAERISVPDYGQVGAGTVVDFIPRGRAWIARPRQARGEGLIAVTVSGDSLERDGIFDGDRLICRLNFELSDLKSARLVIVQLPGGGLVAKHFHLMDDGRVKLKSANKRYRDAIFELSEIEVKALVVESIKSWE